MRASPRVGVWLPGGIWAMVFAVSSAHAQTTTSPATTPATGPGGTTRPWVNPQPDVPYLPKPATRPADWVVEHEPVTPGASPEARALLKTVYALSGRYTLTGQHNYAASQGVFTAQARQLSGKTPAVYGTDWGSERGEVRNRDAIVRELIRRHREGYIIALTWHAVRPTDDEPATFRQSVQGKLTDAEFNDLVTPGTALNARWYAQIDLIAGYMKQLQAARVPLLFRACHEMNGDWFWWGARRGERGTKQVYRLMFERLVHHHKLDNIIWVWNVDRPEREDRQFVDYFPGRAYVDVLSLDSYQQFKQSYYDDLNALSDGKPLAIGELGTNLPPVEIFRTQPKWAWYMIWAGMVPGARGGRGGNNAPPATGPATRPAESFPAFVRDPRMLSLEDDEYPLVVAPLRTAAGLPATLPVAPGGLRGQ